MILSRFWYIALALTLGAAAFTLFVAAHMYNRAGTNAMKDALRADTNAVEWYLNDDGRRRASQLIYVALSSDIRTGLTKASAEEKDKPNKEAREKTKQALKKIAETLDPKFDIVWCVDAGGRVIASAGFEHTENWELGGYAVVADALHGWIRDDAWVWKGVIYRVVARPVEEGPGGFPVGAVIGAKIVNDAFAQAVSKRTGAAVAFYADHVRVASGAPDDFDKGNLDLITQDLKAADSDKNYQEKGVTDSRVLGEHLGVVYHRLPGEAWDLGAGYAVGRLAVAVSSPIDFLNQADDNDKSGVPKLFLVVGALGLAALGLIFTIFEHTRPLSTFRTEVTRIADGKIDVLQPSRFRGIYKKIASDLNDGIEKVSAKGGAPRRAADLEQVLGPIPAQPQMSAFAVPGTPGTPEPDSRPSFPKPPPSQKGAPRLRQSTGGGPVSQPQPPSGPTSAPMSQPHPMSQPMSQPMSEPLSAPAISLEADAIEDPTIAMPARPHPPQPPPPQRRPPPPPGRPAIDAPSVQEASQVATVPADEPPGAYDELEDWRKVYEEFLTAKQQCGEPTQSLTFEKFKGTLQRNKDALVARHRCNRVKFTVYVKEGKAALKASPVK